METTSPSPAAEEPPSLLAVRIAAAVGLVVAIAGVIAGFSTSWWLGLIALVAVPLVPTLFVFVVEQAQRLRR